MKRRPARLSPPRPPAWLASARLWLSLLCTGMVAGAAYGLHALTPHVRAATTADTRIEWMELPAWLDDPHWCGVLDEILGAVALSPQADLFDDNMTPYVYQQLRRSPWVQDVTRVAKLPDGRVRAWAQFRRPFGLIERDGVGFLVDESAVRLPRQLRVGDLDTKDWLPLRGVRGAAPAVGAAWPGDDVVMGLKLARFLYRAEAGDMLPFRNELAAIDVANADGKQDPRGGRLRLITIYPETYIHWGLPPAEEYDIESKAERKLAALRELYARNGRLPDRGPIDVRDQDRILIGRPQTAAQTGASKP